MSHNSLRQLSDHQLITSLNRLVGAERAQLVDVLEHINEVDRRGLHRAGGYASLFDYCVSRLKYSHSAAGRRIAAARALRRVPEIKAMLESGEVNLMTLSLTARLLTPANKDAWLARIRGRSQREVKRMVEELHPETATRDRVRVVCVREPVTLREVALSEIAPLKVTPPVKPQAVGGVTPTGGSESPAPGQNGAEHVGSASVDAGIPAAHERDPATAAGEQRESTPDAVLEPVPTRVVHKHKIQFIAGDEFMTKIETMKALLSSRIPNASLEQVFDAAMEAFLEANCPARRDRRRKRKAAATRDPLPPVGVSRAPGDVAGKPTSRHIPTAVRDAVFARDRGRCTFVGDAGRRCVATRYLEIDHIEPFGRGGTHHPSNLRLLCHVHNRLAAERAYGCHTMAAYARRE